MDGHTGQAGQCTTNPGVIRSNVHLIFTNYRKTIVIPVYGEMLLDWKESKPGGADLWHLNMRMKRYE